jgi:prevent-host-death family protein
MRTISITEAKSKLGKLVEFAAAGETIEITKRGKPMARIVPIDKSAAKIVPLKKKLKPIDFEALWKIANSMPYQEESAGDFIRRMRDEDRY